MGKETVKAVQQETDFTIVAQLEHKDDLAAAISNHQAEIVIDFTSAEAVFDNALTIIESGAHPVIGTTGLLPQQIKELQKRSAEKKLGGIIAPNFSISAVLMMRFAREAARYLPHVEIIELHHDGKLDSPSGTAIKTAEMIAETRDARVIFNHNGVKETIPGARGALHHGIPIHAIRLPGIVANQEIIFGGKSETLEISHTSIHREAFMPGVILACRKVTHLDHLVYGLENIL